MNKLQKKDTELLTGVVLAGGLSSRLGKDKSLLTVTGDEDLLTHSVRLLRAILPKVLVVGRTAPEAECIAGVEYLPDTWANSGPVGGIATALRHSGTNCLILSCDLPFMAPPVLHALITAWENKNPETLLCAYAQKETGKIENLVGIYAYDALPRLEATLEKKLLKIALVIPPENTELLNYSFQDSMPFFNVNYPADLFLVREYLRLKNNFTYPEVPDKNIQPYP